MKNRNAKEIRIWLLRKGVTLAEIARQVKISPTLVTATINGHRNNRKVLRYLVQCKCPRRILDLPEDMKRTA